MSWWVRIWRARLRPRRPCRIWCSSALPPGLGGANLGTVAVIAPTRIQYQEMIQAVRYIARLSERLLEIPAAGDLGM